MKVTSPHALYPDLSEIDEDRWHCARQRMEAIAPLLKSNSFSRHAVQVRATEIGKSPATLYRWFELWRRGETLSSLLPQKPGPCPGQNRLPASLEEIISNVLGKARGKVPRQSAARLAHRITAECKRAGVRLLSQPPRPGHFTPQTLEGNTPLFT